MEKKIEDYLRLYIGCEIQAPSPDEEFVQCKGLLTGIHGEFEAEVQFYDINNNVDEEPSYCPYDRIKPLLRPISDMTEDEMFEMSEITGLLQNENLIKAWVNGSAFSLSIHKMPELFTFLLKKGFDVFGLCEAGLAIDKTKL